MKAFHAGAVLLAAFCAWSPAAVSDEAVCEITRGMQFSGDSPGAYDPQMTFSTIAGGVYRELTGMLFVTKVDGGLIPALAQSYEIEKETNSLHFTLDPDCAWSDGEPVKPEDFILSFRRLVVRSVNTDRLSVNKVLGAREIANGVAEVEKLGVEKTGPHSFRIYLHGSLLEFLLSLGSSRYSPLPSHLMGIDDDFSPLEISSGPFMASEVGPDEMVFVRNPHHCRKMPSNVERLRLVNINDRFAEYSRMLRGEFDVMMFPPEQQLASVRSGQAANLESIDEPSLRQVYLMIKPMAAPEREIRRAISLSIDREAVAGRGNLEAKTRALATTLLHRVAGYEGLSFEEYLGGGSQAERLAEARAIMKAAGYSAENRYKLKITTYPLEIFESTARYVAGMLSQAYFDIEYIRQPSVPAAVAFQGDDAAELFILSWQLDYPNPLDSIYGIYNSTNMNTHLHHYAETDPAAAPAVRAIEDRIRDLVNIYSSEEQAENLREFERNMLSLHVFVPLFSPVGSYIVNKDIKPNGNYIYLRMANFSKASCGG